MPYTRPPHDAANFICDGVAYARPNALAANFGLPESTAVSGTGAVVIEFTADGVGAFLGVPVAGTGGITVSFSAAGEGKHGVKGTGEVSLEIGAIGGGTVVRYELVGNVRKDEIAVERLVRAHRRDTGEMIGETMTVGGLFRVSAGFVQREHYLLPIDMNNDATDWQPPCVNRVVSELALDVI